MRPSSLISIGVGIAAGDALAEALVEDDNVVGKLAVGVIGGLAAEKLTKDVLDTTGFGSVIDDASSFF